MLTEPTQTQPTNFATRVDEAITTQKSLLCVGLDPVYSKLPAQYKRGDVAQDIFCYNRDIIDGAAPYAAAFKPQYKCYSAEGPAGLEALQLTCSYIKEHYPHILLILDAKYADIGSTLENCAREAYDLLHADAVTAMPAPGAQALAPLFTRPDKGCFMVVRTSNPGADELQDIPVAGSGDPLYVEITRRITGWNESGNIGFVGPATDAEVLANIREAAAGMPILCPGVGAQGGDLEAAVQAGMGSNGGGLLINISRAIMEAPDPGEAARKWRDLMQEALNRHKDAAATSARPTLLEDVILEMYRIGAIKFEPVTLKSGLVSPYYNNLRILASHPALLRKVASLLSNTMQQAQVYPDIVVGIAEAGIPLAVALSVYTGIPAGYVRSTAKQHGTKRMVEGDWHEGATALLVDDVVSDGASKLEVLGHLQDAGLPVRDIVVLVDRGQGGPAAMEKHGLHCHAAVKMEDVLSILLKSGSITQTQVDESYSFMQEAQAQAAM